MKSRTIKRARPNTPSQTDVAVEKIRSLIIDLVLEPGARLDEVRLVTEFKLGRTPAREALNRLAVEGFVSIVPNRGGAHVRHLNFSEITQIIVAYSLSESILGQLCRFDDEALVADLEEIQKRYAKMVKARNYLGITAVNQEFHLRMYRTIQNHFIYGYATTIHRHARRLIVLIHKLESAEPNLHGAQFELNVRQHVDIIDAVRRRNRDRFHKLIVLHAQYTQKRLANIIQAMPVDFKPVDFISTDPPFQMSAK